MSEDHPRETEIERPGVPTRPRRPQRLQTGMRGMLVVVACCGVISWSARRVWETEHPVVAAVRQLQTGSPAERTRATRDLMLQGIAEPALAVPALVAALGDRDQDVRIATIEALGAIGGDAAPGGSDGEAVRAALAGLIRSQEDPEPSVRAAVVYALLHIAATRGTAGPIDTLPAFDAIAGRLADPDALVRRSAFDALAIGGPSCTAAPPKALIAALGDRSANHRARAVKVLASFGCSLDPWLPRLLDILEHDEAEVSAACWSLFARERPPAFSAKAIPALANALGNRARVVRSCAARALRPHARDPGIAAALPMLISLLNEPIEPEPGGAGTSSRRVPINDQEQDPAIAAAGVLGRVAPGTTPVGQVVAALAAMARSSHPLRRQAAYGALGQLGPAAESTVPALIDALHKDVPSSHDGFRSDGSFAAEALARIAPGTKSADAALAAFTELLDPATDVALDLRFAAMNAMYAFRAKAVIAIPRLRALRDGPDPQFKRDVDFILAAIERARSMSADQDKARQELRPAR